MSDIYPIRFADQMREHLRSLRKKRGLTQAQAGALIGVSQARIAEIEAKPGLVSFDQMLQLLSLLGANLSLEVAGMPARPSPPADEVKSTAPGLPKAKAVKPATQGAKNARSGASMRSARSKGSAGKSAPQAIERGVNLRKKRGSW